MQKVVIVLVIFIQSSFVYAHSPLKSIILKNSIVLNKAPIKTKINFKSSAKLSKVILEKIEGNAMIILKKILMINSKNHSPTLSQYF